MLIGLIISIIIGAFFFVRGFLLANQKNELIELVYALNLKIDATSDPVKEDFLKFVSDSREWAFEYIEEFQKALNVFIKEVGPSINYFDKYGSVGPESPDKEALNKISLAYRELIKLLPEEK
jgi:hypothetical protein